MSIPRRGSRRVRVGPREYRWYVRRRPTYAQALGWTPMRLAVQASAPGARCVLYVDLRVRRPDNSRAPSQTGVTPAQVREAIERALAVGWAPDRDGPPFTLEYAVPADSSGATMRRVPAR